MFNDSTNSAAHPNESFRFAQLSDPHLSSPTNFSPLRLVNKRILGYLSWLRNRRHTHKRWVLDLAIQKLQSLHVDHCVITGDLTHIGLQNEFTQAIRWLNDLGATRDITVIPGNHDLYVNERWDRSFEILEDYMYGDDCTETVQSKVNNAQERLEQEFPSIRIRGNVAFISVSSVFAAPWFRATGRINQSQLDRLHKLLNRSQLKNLCKVLLIHHPITTHSISKRKRLLNHSQLTDLLCENPVQMVLHGHGHKSHIEKLTCNQGFNIPVIGAASCSSTEKKHGRKAEFLLFDVTPNDNLWHINMRAFNLEKKQNLFIEASNTIFTTQA